MITTKLNRPLKESKHAAETRDYRTNGGRHPGDSRFAKSAAGGVPYTSPHYNGQEKEEGNHVYTEADHQASTQDDTGINPSLETGTDGEGVSSGEASHGETPPDA